MAKSALTVATQQKAAKTGSVGKKKPRNPKRAAKDLKKAADAAASGPANRAAGKDWYSKRLARRAHWRQENPELVARKIAAAKKAADAAKDLALAEEARAKRAAARAKPTASTPILALAAKVLLNAVSAATSG